MNQAPAPDRLMAPMEALVRAPAGRLLRANGATRGRARARARAARLLARSAVAAVGLSFALAGAAAAAHSRPETTTPANGEVVAQAPALIAISFDKPMRVTRIELTNAGGDALRPRAHGRDWRR